MTLQNVFYLVGIVFMSLGILLLIVIGVLLLYIKRKLDDIHNYIEIKANQLKEFTTNPIKKAVEIGSSLLP